MSVAFVIVVAVGLISMGLRLRSMDKTLKRIAEILEAQQQEKDT